MSDAPDSPREARSGRAFFDRPGRVVAVVALVLLLTGVLLLPRIVRELIEWQVSERVDLELTLDDVDLHPIDGAIVLHGIALRAPPDASDASSSGGQARDEGGEDCWLCIDRLVVDLAWRSLREQMLRIDSIRIRAPRLHLVRAERGDLDLPSLRGPDAPTGSDDAPTPSPETSETAQTVETEQAPQDADAPIALRIDRLSVEDGALSYRDLTLASPTPIQLEIEEITVRRFASDSAKAYDSPARLSLDAEVAGAPIELEILWRADPSGMLIEGRLDAEALPLSRVRAYLANTGLHGLDGSLDLGLKIDSRPDARDTATLDLDLHDASIAWQPRPAPGQGPADVPPPAEAGAETPELAVRLSTARLDARLGARRLGGLTDERPHGARLQGELVVADFEAKTPDPPPRFELSWSELSISLTELGIEHASSPSRLQLELDRITLDAPVLRLAHDADGLLIPGRSLRSAPPATADGRQEDAQEDGEEHLEKDSGEEQDPARRPRIRVGSLHISEGLIEWKDRRVEPFARVALEALSCEAERFAWPEGELDSLEIAAKPSSGERLTLSGSARWPRWEATLEAQRIAIEPFNPYLEKHAGYRAERGQLSLDSRAETVDDRMESDSQLTLHALLLRSTDDEHAFRSRFGVPLSVGLALMRDRAGDIELDFGIDVSRDEGLTLDLASTIRAAIGRAIVNAIATPLRLLGRVERDGTQIASFEPLVLAFVPGEASLEPESEQELESIADLMVARPQLAIELQGQAPTSADADAEPHVDDDAEADADADAPDRPENAPSAEELARSRIDRVCRFFRDLRGLSAERILVRRDVRRGSDLEPGVHLSLSTFEPDTASAAAPAASCAEASGIRTEASGGQPEQGSVRRLSTKLIVSTPPRPSTSMPGHGT